jgi:uncharacterized membrane protein YccC
MTDATSRGRLRVAAIRESARRAVAPARLLLVAKTAVAVALAWLVAPHIPGVVNDYPYYAPLGALISMYPILMESVRSGVQTILGLAAGIGLATLVIVTAGPNWWTIPAVVGVALLVSGTGWFGAGREYVPIPALFVIIVVETRWTSRQVTSQRVSRWIRPTATGASYASRSWPSER